nr:hypothetical protein [Tanacetum cinerariifolium]
MDTTKAQQIALDDALVAPANRLKIGKCNHRLSSTLKSNEPTLQVVLDALKLTPFYKASQINANVLEIYMQEFWATVSIHHTSLRFKMNDKSHTLNLENFRDMLQICPKLPDSLRLSSAQIICGMYHKKNVDYVDLLWEDLETQIYSVILPNELTNQEMLDSKAYKEYYAVASRAEPPKEKTKYKKKANELVTPFKSKSASADKAKGLAVLSEVALTEDEQIKLATKRSKKDFYMSHASGSGAGVRSEVPDVPKYNSKSEKESWTFSQDDKDDVEESYMNDENKETESDQRVYTPPDHQLTNEKENQEGNGEVREGVEEQEEKEELYGDLNINLQRNLVSKFINSSPDTGIDSILNPNTQTQTLVKIPIFVAVETPSSDTIIPQPPIPNIQPLQQTPDSTMKAIIKDQVQAQVSKIMPKIEKYVTESLGAEVLILIDKMEENKSINRSDIQKDLYNALVESYNSKKDIISSYGDVVTLKRGRDDQDKDGEPLISCNRAQDVDERQWNPSSSPTPDHEWHKTKTVDNRPPQPWITQMAQVAGTQSSKYTTSITKTKAADYGQVKWIEDKVSRIWSSIEVVYDKHAYWETYHWCPKRQKFYGYASNMETSKDDDQLYKFGEGDFKRLHRQDIKDMLLLLVQKRVEDLHFGVESYLKKINLTSPDTYRLDLQRMAPYTAYPDIPCIIYEDEMNSLMCTDELHKFSDGTLNHVRIALNDIATGIEMDYLP